MGIWFKVFFFFFGLLYFLLTLRPAGYEEEGKKRRREGGTATIKINQTVLLLDSLSFFLFRLPSPLVLHVFVRHLHL